MEVPLLDPHSKFFHVLQESQMSIPHGFRCPISLDIFTDPVTLSTGHTYDRPSIEKWLADGNLTCPVTMQTLRDTSLVPNHTLRLLIDQWLRIGPDMSSRQRSTKSDVGFPLSTLKQDFESPETSLETKLEALRKVRILSVESDVGQAYLVQLGFFPLLLELLFQPPHLVDSELVEEALDCILSLSPSTHPDSLNRLKQESNLSSLVLLLDRGSLKIKTSICYLLEAIATSRVNQDLCLLLGRTRRVLQTLVSLLQDRSDTQATEAAVRAISSVCSLEANRGHAIREGAIDGLVSYLSGPTRTTDSRALATLELLLGVEMGRKALIRNTNAVHVLVKLVFRVSSDHEGSEHAVGSLLVVCRDSARARAEAVNAGAVTQLLLLLQSQCSGKAKSNARDLLKLLRAMWAEDPEGG